MYSVFMDLGKVYDGADSGSLQDIPIIHGIESISLKGMILQLTFSYSYLPYMLVQDMM